MPAACGERHGAIGGKRPRALAQLGAKRPANAARRGRGGEAHEQQRRGAEGERVEREREWRGDEAEYDSGERRTRQARRGVGELEARVGLGQVRGLDDVAHVRRVGQ
jgi:hypothetical protein